MNKETIVKEVIEILSTSNYIDTSEDLYDGLKQINREITLNTVHDFLWALESSTVIDMDGKVSECSEKIKSLLEYMNNERYNQIIDEAYENYKKITNSFQLQNPIDDLIIKTLRGEMIKIETEDGDDYRILSKEEFINKCITDIEFSKRWGVTIYTEVEEDEVWMGIVYNGNAAKIKIK